MSGEYAVLRSFDFASVYASYFAKAPTGKKASPDRQDRRAVQYWLHFSANVEERLRDHMRAQVLRLRTNGIIIAAGSRSYRSDVA
jgi:hypothetical protein